MVHVRELAEDQAQAAAAHHRVYKELWHDVASKVRAANAAGMQRLEYRLSPPGIIMLGQPLVSCQRAARYIRDKLTKGGFEVVAYDLGQVGVLIEVTWHAYLPDVKRLLSSAAAPPKLQPPDPAPQQAAMQAQPPPPPAAAACLCLEELAHQDY